MAERKFKLARWGMAKSNDKLIEGRVIGAARIGGRRFRSIVLSNDIKGMSLDDMIEASQLTEKYLKGVKVASLKSLSTSNKAKEYLRKIEKRNKINHLYGYQSLARLNRNIVKKNELENEPSERTKQIYKELLQVKMD